MNKRTAGIILICVAAFLYAVQYVAAALMAPEGGVWDSAVFRDLLQSVGDGPIFWSVLAFIAGIGYIVFHEFEDYIKGGVKRVKENWNEESSNAEKNRGNG